MSHRFSPVTALLKAGLAAAFVAATLLVAVAAPPAHATSAAKPSSSPCWKLLLNDWYDGRIDQTYPIHCYRDALKHLPTDVQTYSSAHDDILRALQTAITEEKKAGKTVGNNTLVPPQKGGKTANSTGSQTTTGSTTTTGGAPGRQDGGGIAGGLDNSNGPSSLPVPLLVLGGLALLLVAAGAAGLIAKRIQSRRANP